MNIDEAIEFNLDTLQYGAHILDTKCYKALELGIEALKRHQKRACTTFTGMMEPLPGETPKNYHPNTITILKKLKESPLGREPKA